MEALRILEEKVTLLVSGRKKDLETIAHLQDENSRLLMENEVLLEKVTKLEETLLSRDEDSLKVDEEREMTKLVVDDLIQHIDGILEKEMHS